MKNTKKIFIITSIISLSLLAIFLGSSLIYQDKNQETLQNEAKKHFSDLAMMIETDAGSGNYQESPDTSWTEVIEKGYVFNETLSKCENGSELSWDNVNKKVIFSGSAPDKCYIYFDKQTLPQACTGQQMGSCIAANYNLDSSIIYHDGVEGDYAAYEAGDNGYRYTGANPNNYVCFGDDCTSSDSLYRIIGVFGNQVKLIKNTSIGDYYWSGSSTNQKNTWSESTVKTETLNGTYLTGLGPTWSNKIATVTWKVGGNIWANIGAQTNAKLAYQTEITNPDSINTTDNKVEDTFKVGLMYVSDYRYAADPTKENAWSALSAENYNNSTVKDNNWMSGILEWTITRNSDNTYSAFCVSSTGIVYNYYVYTSNGMRPVFYLNPSVTLTGGLGTQENPFTIN